MVKGYLWELWYSVKVPFYFFVGLEVFLAVAEKIAADSLAHSHFGALA